MREIEKLEPIIKKAKMTDSIMNIIQMNFWDIVNSRKNKRGIRLQRTRFIIMYMGWPFTFTIERGNRLNDRSVD